MSLDDLDPVLPTFTLPENLRDLQRADLVALCDGAGLLVKKSETAADLRRRLVAHQSEAERRQQERARYQREAEYRKRVPAPRPDPAVEAVRAGLWNLANLANSFEREDIVSALYAVLPALDGYINNKGTTREEARGALTSLETMLRMRADRMDAQSGQVAFSLRDVSRLQQHHAAADEARHAARKAEETARKARLAQPD